MDTTRLLLIFLLLCSTAFATNTAIYSFNSGEWDPFGYGRPDLEKWYSGCRTLENMLVMPFGGATRRPGTKYIATVKDSTKKVRLIPFAHSIEDTYVIEFGDLYARAYKDGAQIMDGVGTEDVSALDNIIAHYLMNETEGSTVVDDEGNHNGTSSVTIPTIATDGKVGAGSFDLDAQYDFEMADHADFSFTDDSDDDPFSIVCWAYVSPANEEQVIMSKWIDQGATSEWKLSLDANRRLQLILTDSNSDISGNVVAQWKLNDDLATKAVLDETVASHDGLLQVDNSEDVTATGKLDKCFQFAGTEAVVITNDHDDLSFNNGNDGGLDATADEPFSIAAWVYFDGNGVSQDILSKNDWTSGSELREWHLWQFAGSLGLSLFDENANALQALYATDAMSAGWHFVVGTYGGAGGSSATDDITLYIDGGAVGTTVITYGTYVAMQNTSTKVIIGAWTDVNGSLGQYWRRELDNVILFDIELAQSDVTALYNSGSGTEDIPSVQVSSVTDGSLDIGWHYIAATYSAPADESTAADGIILYVDNIAADVTATNDNNYTAMQNDAQEVRVGSQRNSGDSANELFWADKIDELSIYSDVLTPTEIASLYSTTPFEITTTYLEADLFNIQYIQSADVLFLAHPDYPQATLSRAGDTVWTLSDLTFERGPFIPENSTDTTITPSAITGNGITLTASSSVFNADHVGSLWKVAYNIGTDVVLGSFTSVSTSATTDVQIGRSWKFITGETWEGTVEIQRSYDSGTIWETVEVYPGETSNVSDTDIEVVDDAIYRVKMTAYTSGTCDYTFTSNGFQLDGVVEITGVTSGISATADVKVDLGGTAATKIWAEGAWSDFRGYPSTLAFFEERLTYAATAYQPQTIWFSVTDDWTNFRPGSLDSDALTFTLAADQVNAIKWMSPKTRLVMGTSGGEWTIGSRSPDEGLTAATVKVVRHSTYGSADLQAIAVNNVILFPQREARKVRELTYSFAIDEYVSPEMTVLSGHITEGGIVDMAYQSAPDSVLWTILAGGDIAAMTYNREQDVIGWHQHITDGNFESIAIIPESEDEIWVSVLRTIGGSPARYIEQFQARDYGDDQDDAFYVDSGITYDSTPTTIITGLSHLEGETVYVLGDGVKQDSQVVSGAAITITSASTVQVGLPYTSTLSPMDLNISLRDGSMMGRKKKIVEVVTRFHETSACNMGPTSTDYRVLSFDSTPFTGDFPETWGGSYERSAYMVLFTDDPLPMTVLSLMPNYKVGN